MVLILYVNIVVTEKNRISEYKIIVYADHLSFLGKWSFLVAFGNKINDKLWRSTYERTEKISLA